MKSNILYLKETPEKIIKELKVDQIKDLIIIYWDNEGKFNFLTSDMKILELLGTLSMAKIDALKMMES